MQLTTEINAMVELQDALEKITQRDMDWAARDCRVASQEEKILGMIENDVTRRMWALTARLRALADAEGAQAKLEQDQERERERTVKSVRLRQLAEIAGCICWGQIRDELDIWLSDRGAQWQGIGIRQGWLVVLLPAPRSPFANMLSSHE